MKIIVAQRHVGNLEGIREAVARLDPQRARQIVFTTDPIVALQNIPLDEQVLVVSGNVFTGSWSGAALAQAVKLASPGNVIFFTYSVLSERAPAVDGIIPKENQTVRTGHHDLLARILTSKIEDLTIARIKELFPEVQFPEVPRW